jgi:hypothetical protein
MKLLSINIPTYERLNSFSEVLLELTSEINALSKEHKAMIEVNVFENDSSTHQEKEKLCSKIASESVIPIKFKKNETNIGADRNILQCCIANQSAIFTWVLGDDDHVVAGSLSKIVFLLLNNINTLGVLILSDGNYTVDEKLINKRISSYYLFARLASTIQPHYLIAHTLISLNIFRTTLFNEAESTYVTCDLTERMGLVANFSHMRGMVKGLLSQSGKSCCVLTPDFVAIDTTRRLPAAVNFDADILKIYYYYYLWLLSEIGIRVDEVARQPNMWWLFESEKSKPLQEN